jgi:heme A synthase
VVEPEPVAGAGVRSLTPSPEGSLAALAASQRALFVAFAVTMSAHRRAKSGDQRGAALLIALVLVQIGLGALAVGNRLPLWAVLALI